MTYGISLLTSRIALLACLAATMLLLHSSSQQGATGCKVMPCEFLVSNIVMCLFLKKSRRNYTHYCSAWLLHQRRPLPEGTELRPPAVQVRTGDGFLISQTNFFPSSSSFFEKGALGFQSRGGCNYKEYFFYRELTFCNLYVPRVWNPLYWLKAAEPGTADAEKAGIRRPVWRLRGRRLI